MILPSDVVKHSAHHWQGFLGIKMAMGLHVDKTTGGSFRKPLAPVGEDAIKDLREGLAKIMELEKSL